MNDRINKNYNELILLNSFDERANYLRTYGIVGDESFGFDRYMNQQFYKSREWKFLRSKIIVRDNACDLAFPNREIFGSIYIHHIIPLTEDDIKHGSPLLLDPNNLVCVSFETHNFIHYGIENTISKPDFVERTKNDTCPWRK